MIFMLLNEILLPYLYFDDMNIRKCLKWDASDLVVSVSFPLVFRFHRQCRDVPPVSLLLPHRGGPPPAAADLLVSRTQQKLLLPARTSRRLWKGPSLGGDQVGFFIYSCLNTRYSSWDRTLLYRLSVRAMMTPSGDYRLFCVLFTFGFIPSEDTTLLVLTWFLLKVE